MEVVIISKNQENLPQDSLINRHKPLLVLASIMLLNFETNFILRRLEIITNLLHCKPNTAAKRSQIRKPMLIDATGCERLN